MALKLPEDLKSLVGTHIENDNNRYIVTKYRGSGKRGHVFRAELADGRVRALKFVPLKKLSGQWDQEMYKAHLLEDQPNTVRFRSFFYHEKKYGVMIFDYVDGPSLREKTVQRELTVSHVQRILESLLFFRIDCLNTQKGLRHGDLHPGNIILKKPQMGAPRPYEVMITDFGIGYTGAVPEPKDDFVQIGIITTKMLQSVIREKLDQGDRVVYDQLCSMALKRLREHSPLERGDEKAALEELLAELNSIKDREAMPEPNAIIHTTFGDYLAGEQIGNRWQEWEDLFVSDFPGYEDIVSRNTTVLTGTRGCGKTMVFRRLSALLSFEVGRVDKGAAGALVGIYLNMNDIADAFLFDKRKKLSDRLAKRIIQFFHLSLLSEIIRVSAIAREKVPQNKQESYDRANRWLFEFVNEHIGASKQLYPGPVLEMRDAGSIIEQAKDKIRYSKTPSKEFSMFEQSDWLRRFVPELQENMPWIEGKPLYFFLDDYSMPRVNESLQKVLNSVIFQRSDSFFFKISTESPSTLYREDYSGKVLGYTDDFELTDLGSITIDLSDEMREDFLDKVFSRRFNRDKRYKGKGLLEVLGEFKSSWVDLARNIRKDKDEKKSESALEDTSAGKVLYHGKKVFVNMWSGDTRSMVKIAQNILDQNQNELLPIDSKLQNRILRDTGGEFLHLLRACTMTAREKFDPELSGIDSWGEHLVKIAESFKDIASYELRHFDGGRKMRDEPKQAFRIEIVDNFVLSGIERELYEDLIRYGVFLRDDRGKSIRGAIIPRLYLRRLLIPFCTLTFSKIDNISMKSDEFKELLLKPKSCFTKWKRKRERRPKDVHGQKQFEFEE